uniref:Uncharacterized protein LOC105642006 isoform X2 n=1 Tax=Rhizophora mucronata TaxID=61149 RepID=A0A2P2JXY7_RHIMU
MGIAPAAVVATRALLCNNHCSKSRPLISHHHQKRKIRKITTVFSGETWSTAPVAALYLKGPHHPRKTPLVCHSARRKPTVVSNAAVSSEEGNDNVRKVLQVILWVAEGIYILWLFLLPYAPGDPVWAISKDTVDSLIGLSLNFFFILPLMNYGMCK